MITLHSRRADDLLQVVAFAVSVGCDVPCVVVVRRTLCCTRVPRLTRPSARAENLFDSRVDDPQTLPKLSFVCSPPRSSYIPHVELRLPNTNCEIFL